MRLRQMQMDDADFMLKLKNDPQTRQFAIASHDEIDSEDHYRWLRKHCIYFQVVEKDDGIAIGAVRIFANEISIWIDRDYWGVGIATNVLNKVATHGSHAKIVDGNVGSMRAFIKAGFVPIAHENNYYILRK